VKTLWRVVEWLLALGWLLVTLRIVASWRELGPTGGFWPRWGDLQFPGLLLIPLIGPVVIRLFSAPVLDLRKRSWLIAVLVSGAGLAVVFRPGRYDPPSLFGVFVPMVLYGAAAFLWLSWRKPAGA